MRMVSIVICDSLPGMLEGARRMLLHAFSLVYVFLSMSSIRATPTLVEIKKLTTFLDNQPNNSIVRDHSREKTSDDDVFVLQPLASLQQGQKMLDVRRLVIRRGHVSANQSKGESMRACFALSQTNAAIRISIPYDMTLVWSTKLHLFLYRYVSSLKSSAPMARTGANDNQTAAPSKAQFEFEIDACAHVYIQLSSDSRYVPRWNTTNGRSTVPFRIHAELHQFSGRLQIDRAHLNDSQVELKCMQVLVDCQQQCVFTIHVSFIVDNDGRPSLMRLLSIRTSPLRVSCNPRI